MVGGVPRGGSPGFSPEALRRILTRDGVTIEDLADEIGVSRQAVSAWLKGVTRPSPRSLVRAAEVLGVSAGDLTPHSSSRIHLADLRSRSGFNQAELAGRLGIAPSKLSDIERGRQRTDEDLAARIASVLEVEEADVVAAWDNGYEDRDRARRARGMARRRGNQSPQL